MTTRWNYATARWNEHWYWARGIGGTALERDGEWWVYPARNIPGCNRFGPFPSAGVARDSAELLVALDDIEAALFPPEAETSPERTPHLGGFLAALAGHRARTLRILAEKARA